MKNINFTKSLTAGVALAMALYPQVWAGVATPCGANEANCWSCGADCSARLDSTGKLSIYGSGTMYDYSYDYATSYEKTTYGNSYATSAPWRVKIGEITGIDIQGVTSVGQAAFIGMKRATSVNIGDSVTSVGSYALNDCKFSEIYLSPSVVSVGENAFWNNYNLTRVVSSIGYIAKNGGLSNNVFYKYQQEGGLIYMYDKDNNIKGIFESQTDLKDAVLGNGQARIEYDTNGNFMVYNSTGDKGVKYDANGNFLANYIKGADDLFLAYDANGNVIAKYDADNNLLSSYSYASDGSVYTYDANGKLTGAKKKTPFTPAEAAALIKKGNNNRVTLTIK